MKHVARAFLVIAALVAVCPPAAGAPRIFGIKISGSLPISKLFQLASMGYTALHGLHHVKRVVAKPVPKPTAAAPAPAPKPS